MPWLEEEEEEEDGGRQFDRRVQIARDRVVKTSNKLHGVGGVHCRRLRM